MCAEMIKVFPRNSDPILEAPRDGFQRRMNHAQSITIHNDSVMIRTATRVITWVDVDMLAAAAFGKLSTTA